jgi:hypothetical protein
MSLHERETKPATANPAEDHPDLREKIRDLAALRARLARYRALHLEVIQTYEALLAAEAKQERVVKDTAAVELPIRVPIYEAGLEVTYTPQFSLDAETLLALYPDAAHVPGVVQVKSVVDADALRYAVAHGMIPEDAAEQAKCVLKARVVTIK